MLKRTVSLILTALLILSVFSGCNLQMTMLPNNTKPTATKPVISTEPTEPAETTKPTEATQPTQSTRPSQPSADSARPLEMPEDTPCIVNGIYVIGANYYYTLYVGNWIGTRRYEDINIYLMSEDPLPGDTIVTNLQADHTVYLTDITPQRFRATQFLYCKMMGSDIDFAKMWELEKANQDAELAFREGKVTRDDVTETWNQRMNYYNMVGQPYEEQYQAANRENDKFYYYKVVVRIREFVREETLTSLELITGDSTISLPIGGIQLREMKDPSTDELNDRVFRGMSLKDEHLIPEFKSSRPASGSSPRPWYQGELYATRLFFVLENMTLTDVSFFNGGERGCEITGAEVQITGTNGMITQMDWTPGTPLVVRKDEILQVRVYFRDPYTNMAEYNAKYYFVLEYQSEGETGKTLMRSAPQGEWSNKAELYLWAFTDVDVKEYYDEYYLPMQTYYATH